MDDVAGSRGREQCQRFMKPEVDELVCGFETIQTLSHLSPWLLIEGRAHRSKATLLKDFTRTPAAQQPAPQEPRALHRCSKTLTPEAIGFLLAVGIFVVLLAVIFLFINRKLCFSHVGGLPCLEQYSRRRGSRNKGGVHQSLEVEAQ
ncbi:synaptotagmin-16-like [Arapaima gigas]